MFIRTRIINGRVYRNRATSVWDPVKKRPRSVYLGKVDDDIERALHVAERAAEKIRAEQREKFGETGEERAARLAEANRFEAAKFLAETSAHNQDASGEQDAGEGDKGEEGDV